MKTAVSLITFGLLFAGCSTLSVDQHFAQLGQKVGNQTPIRWIKTAEEAKSVNDRISILLTQPLSMDNAVRIALMNNRTLQKTYEEIGISHSELVEAGLMSNPVLGYSIGSGGGVRTSTWSLEIAFLDLLWIPLRRELAGMELEVTKLRAGDEVMKTVMETRNAWIDLSVAQEKEKLSQELLQTSEVSAQLATRQHSAGNLSKRDFLKIWKEYLDVRIEHIRALEERASAQESLNRILGLFGTQTRYRLAEEKPELKSLGELPQMEQKAIKHRLDVAAAREKVLLMGKNAGYAENTRFLDEVTLGVERENTSGEAAFDTFSVGIPLPLFDFGQGRVSKSQALYRQSLHELYELSVNVRSEVREGYAKARYAYDIAAEYENSVVKTNQGIVEQTGLYYNGMLDGIYELLEDQRQLTMSKIEAAEARGKYLKSLAELTYLIGTDPYESEQMHQ